MRNGWTVIECMSAGDPTLVFDGGRPRRYGSVRRREHLKSAQITTAILAAIDEVKSSRAEIQKPVAVEDHPPYILHALPIMGPFETVYGVQVYFGDKGQTPPPPRRAGAFLWEPSTQLTHHGPTIETDILGITDPQDVRVSPEVFKHFEVFPREGELGPYVADIMAGRVEEGETFHSDLTLRKEGGELAQAFMTMRAVLDPAGQWGLRGIVHDISDVIEPEPTYAYDRNTARSAARLTDGDWGIGHIDFPTRIVTEWLTPPPEPLDRWATQNAEFHPDDDAEVMQAQLAVATGREIRAVYQARVRFPGVPWWYTAIFTITAATAGAKGHGLIRVESADVPPEAITAEEEDSSLTHTADSEASDTTKEFSSDKSQR